MTRIVSFLWMVIGLYTAARFGDNVTAMLCLIVATISYVGIEIRESVDKINEKINN